MICNDDDCSSGTGTYRLRGRLWIEGADGTFVGYGRAILLARIQEHGSISAAARSMEMSYRHAWRLVDSMNKQSRQPVVEKSTGGKGGGGAVVTATGERAMVEFWSAYKGMTAYLDKCSSELNI